MSRGLTVLAFVAGCLPALSQGKKIATAEVQEPILFASVDRPGDLYVLLKSGGMIKFDKQGQSLIEVKFESKPSLIDPGDGTSAFVYFQKEQKIEKFSADLTERHSKTINAEFAVRSWLVCPSKNELWIIDSVDLSLKKTKDRGTNIAVDVSWAPAGTIKPTDIKYMREYLNFLFIQVKGNGVIVVNSIGKKIRTIDQGDVPYFNFGDVPYFNFLGEEIYYPGKAHTLEFLDLYTAERRTISLPYPTDFALVTDERMILIAGKKIEFFEYKP